MFIFPLKFLYRPLLLPAAFYVWYHPRLHHLQHCRLDWTVLFKQSLKWWLARPVLQTSQSLPPTERRHQSYQVSEGEGEGDQHQGEAEAEEKEPNVEFLLSAGSESETASCLNFPGLTGPLYPHVLRGEFLFLSVATNCPKQPCHPFFKGIYTIY